MSTSWVDVVIREIDRDGERLSEWEANFLESVMRQREAGRRLSDRQLETLNRIHEQRVAQGGR